MPLYEYECQSCQHRFEVIQKYSDPPVDACRACGGPVTKLLSSPAIQFKGSGFYLTDYGRGTGKPEGGAKSEKTKTDGAKTEGGTSEAGKSDGGKTESTKSDSGSSSAESKSSSSDSTSPSAKSPASSGSQ